ncbi:MAG: uL30 family ribosomal protein [Candidatus Micrarchaeota archaeon]|nr:uL30 family ribosomal protein [Candidatus Micrarchaeota archaeon]
MAEAKNDTLVAVVRIRGRVNVRSDITETLNRLHLKRVNNCALIKQTPSLHGMIHKVENYVAYGEINEPTLAKLLGKYAASMNPKEVLAGKIDQAKMKELMPFRLHPPRHGFKSTKLSAKNGGDLGYRGTDINNLIGRMI